MATEYSTESPQGVNNTQMMHRLTTIKTNDTYEGIRPILKKNIETSHYSRKDRLGTEIDHNIKAHSVTFRDDIIQVPIYDIHEIETHKNIHHSSLACQCVMF